jgi:PKD repeat protein
MTRLLMPACAIVLLGGCMMQNQSAPPLMGPSTLALALTMTATPDTLARDGSSQSIVTVNFRDGATDQPLTQRRLVLSASAGTLSVPEVVTDSAGNASFTFIAPSVNTPVNSVSVSATPVGDNATNNASRTVVIQVIGPDVPFANFSFLPTSASTGQTMTFDAIATTLNGSQCGSACTYAWDFGDGSSGSGVLVQHAFAGAGVQTVTLTVTGPGGASNSTSKSFVVAAPAAPIASFTVTPASPVRNSQAVFNATGSTVGTGATIAQYNWDFGDATTATATVPITTKTYTVAGTYVVTLTVTDSLNRTATVTATVTVVP